MSTANQQKKESNMKNFTKTHTRNDGKVDVNLVSDNGETAIYYRQFKTPKGKTVTMPWGACPTERFEREFSLC